MKGHHVFYPPCPYCGGKVTGVSMQQQITPEPMEWLLEANEMKFKTIQESVWMLEPCNHKALTGSYTVTVAQASAYTGIAPPVDAALGTVWVQPNGSISVKTEAGWAMVAPKKGPGVYIESAMPPKGGHAISVGVSWYEQYIHNHNHSGVVGGDTVVSDLTEWLPGLHAVVKCPARYHTACGLPGCSLHPGPCSYEHSVQNVIVHLNDSHRWPREEVADWLETLDVDLTFPTEKPVKKKLPYADPNDKLVIVGPTIAAIREEARRRRRNPQDVIEVLNGHPGAMRLRGYHRLQYTVMPGVVLTDELRSMLDYYEFREVGAEAPAAPSPYEGAPKILKEVYAAKVEAMLNDPVEKFFDQGSEGSSVGYAVQASSHVLKYADIKAAMDKLVADYVIPSSHVDPWPGEAVYHDPVQKALDHKASQSSHWAKFSKPTNPLKSKKKGH